MDNTPISLVPILEDGAVDIQPPDGGFESVVNQVLQTTAAMYERAGSYQAPWVGYLGIRTAGDAPVQVVGTCSFKAPPSEGRVEIAYFTFPGYGQQGLATQMAKALVTTAHGADKSLLVRAQTMPENLPSQRVLQKLGFVFQGIVENDRDGCVQEWHLHPSP